MVGEVSAERDGGPADFADDRAVGKAVRPGESALVDSRELLKPVIEVRADDLADRGVSNPPVQFPGLPVQLGMWRESARKAPAEVERTPGAQLGPHLIGQRAGLDRGQGPARMLDDVRVRREVLAGVHWAIRPWLTAGP